jgi:hypothetical protein
LQAIANTIDRFDRVFVTADGLEFASQVHDVGFNRFLTPVNLIFSCGINFTLIAKSQKLVKTIGDIKSIGQIFSPY